MNRDEVNQLIKFLENFDKEKANQLRDLLDKNSDKTQFNVSMSYKLEKFEGELEEDKTPFETIIGGDTIPLQVIRG